jgi:hypothetical protein
VDSWIEQFIITEDNNILTLMQSTIKYCLLRLYLSSGTSMSDNEQNAAIKAHIRRTNATGSDPEDDAWTPGASTTLHVLPPQSPRQGPQQQFKTRQHKGVPHPDLAGPHKHPGPEQEVVLYHQRLQQEQGQA